MNVAIPASLRACAGGGAVVPAEGATVRDLLADLARRQPALHARLCDERGQLRKFIALFVNGRDIRTLQGDATPLDGRAEVVIVAAIAGG